MAQAAVRADLYQALDVQRNFTTQVALYEDALLVDHFTKLDLLSLGQVLYAGIRIDTSGSQNIVGSLSANTVNVGQADLYALLSRKIYTGDSCHINCTS